MNSTLDQQNEYSPQGRYSLNQNERENQRSLSISNSPNTLRYSKDNNNIVGGSKNKCLTLNEKQQSRKELDDYTNQYFNESSRQSLVRSSSKSQCKTQNIRSSSSQCHQYKNLSTTCDSREVSRMTPERQYQQQQYKNLKSRQDSRCNSQMNLNASQAIRLQINQNSSSFNQTPPRLSHTRSSCEGSSTKDNYKLCSPFKAKGIKFQATTQIPLQSTEIIGSLSSSTVLNRGTTRVNGSIISSTLQKVAGLDGMMKKSAINRLGLTLKPVCSAHKNQQLKYICVDQKCIEQERVLCEQCIDSFGHGLHEIKTIEEYILVIESSYDTFKRKFYHFKTIKEELEHPPFLGSINLTINNLKSTICNRLDSIKENVYTTYKKMLQELDQPNQSNGNTRLSQRAEQKELKQNGCYLNSQDKNRFSQQMLYEFQQKPKGCLEAYNQEIERMEEVGSFLESIIEKNFFDLNKQDINMSLALVNRNHYLQLNDLHSSMTQKYQKLEQIFSDAINTYSDTLYQYFNNTFENQCLFKLPNQEEEEEEQVSRDVILKSLHEQLEELEKEIKLKRKQVKIIREEILSKQHVKISKTIIRKEPTFPYNTYSTNCYHMVENGTLCNTVPIFECCQQAYQCVQCHYKFCKHVPKITNPSKRYCMKCIQVFKVNFPTDIAINCDDCINKDL